MHRRLQVTVASVTVDCASLVLVECQKRYSHYGDYVEFTLSCKLLNHLFSTLAVRCRRDFASSEEVCIVCLRDFCGTTATFILPTCPVVLTNFLVTFPTVWLPHFTTLDVLTVPDRRTIDPSSARSAS